MTQFEFSDFNPSVYKQLNQDLREQNWSDEELFRHFLQHGNSEHRTYAEVNSTLDRLSMKHLRGQGVEIGAGKSPTPLFGNAECVYADIASHTIFDSSDYSGDKLLININTVSRRPNDESVEKWDFVIASHVLEHCDSIFHGLRNISWMLKRG
ncbi:MAG: hypothetical protein HY052_09460, partial [Proteobacteria bacterium]|nr:hypothetical protein [Pseudomonadota bacterium]